MKHTTKAQQEFGIEIRTKNNLYKFYSFFFNGYSATTTNSVIDSGFLNIFKEVIKKSGDKIVKWKIFHESDIDKRVGSREAPVREYIETNNNNINCYWSTKYLNPLGVSLSGQHDCIEELFINDGNIYSEKLVINLPDDEEPDKNIKMTFTNYLFCPEKGKVKTNLQLEC